MPDSTDWTPAPLVFVPVMEGTAIFPAGSVRKYTERPSKSKARARRKVAAARVEGARRLKAARCKARHSQYPYCPDCGSF